MGFSTENWSYLGNGKTYDQGYYSLRFSEFLADIVRFIN